MTGRQLGATVWLVGCVVLGSVSTPPISGTGLEVPAEQVRSTPEGLALMQHHFIRVGVTHDAVIRGDLREAAQRAGEVAKLDTPPNVAAAAAPHVSAMRTAATRAAGAQDLATAAAGVASMLKACGDCHRTVGTRPVPATPKRPDVGGLVGHMLEHQRAADEMLEGLLVPSESQWTRGATRLVGAPLDREALPRDRKLTSEIRASEDQVHRLAERAIKARDWNERANVYGQVLTSCANCHSLHGLIWGPRRPPVR